MIICPLFIFNNKMSNLSLNNFKVIHLSESKLEEKYSCLFCDIKVGRVAIFIECSHFCCTDCLDNIYDNYENDKKELFICPLCNEKIYDIDYMT